MSLSSKIYAANMARAYKAAAAFERAALGPKVSKNWECLECGRLMTRRAAERAVNGAGCPGCGGSDIDLARVPNTAL